MKRFFSQITQRNNGFTVIEAFVGISILLIGLVGPLMLVNTNLQAGRFSRDQITAYYLAQEAIEMVREGRDENFLGGVNWLSGSNLNYCIGKTGTNGCKVDGRDGGSNFDPCTSCNNLQGNNVLRVDESTGEYGYSGGSPSRFYRYVQIQETDSNQGAIVTVRVGFDTGRYIQEYVTRDYLRNWSPR